MRRKKEKEKVQVKGLLAGWFSRINCRGVGFYVRNKEAPGDEVRSFFRRTELHSLFQRTSSASNLCNDANEQSGDFVKRNRTRGENKTKRKPSSSVGCDDVEALRFVALD